MSLYVVVEGRRTEPRLYRAWLPLLFPGIQEAPRIEDAIGNHFFLLAGEGYPSYLDRIRNAIADMNLDGMRFTHLLVSVDAEECSHDERLAEIEDVMRDAGCSVAFTVIVANCCIEAWLLGNRKFVRRNPEDEELRSFLEHYDVREHDPEGILPRPTHRTRAALCLSYLKAAFRERKQSYTKHNPGPAATEPYFFALCERARATAQTPRHLRSFARLLELPGRVTLAPLE
ncbi:hypothetical protein [Paraliomyxa miuraensis]|uniref:hypothetical protein n=1 Tax=Paraliomyxa miuraensis TaxID=376150 RepID=UPI00225AEA52|nr:hypothetical protein [Paraliomyxa miuraensis]MCX4244072.1 hypothetical protein [Paraliomyxa miuraensis]